jgi:tRNA-binding EMAP/Myf-like protein
VGIIMTIVTAAQTLRKAHSLISTKTVIITNLKLVRFIQSFVRGMICIIMTMAIAIAIANIVGIIMHFTMSNKKTAQ